MGDAASSPLRGAVYWPSGLVAAIGLIVLFGIHRASPRTLLSAHGLLHSAILERFQRDWSVPPENPFFAGEPLGYYWFFQALGATVSGVTGLDPIHSFEVLVGLAFIGMVACATGLARRLYGSAPVGALIAFLVVAGANVQAPLLLAYRYARVGPSILAERPEYLWGIVHTLSSQLRLDDKWGMHGPLVNFFLNVTARPLALSACLAVLLAFHRALARPDGRRLGVLCAVVALTSALSVLAGAAIAGSLAAALCVLRVAARTPLAPHLEPAPAPRPDGVDEDARALRVGLALVAGVLVAAPTYWQIFALGSGGLVVAGDGIGGILRAAVMLLAACGFDLVLVGIGIGLLRERFPRFAGASGPTRHFVILLGVAALGLVGVTAVVSLPVGNQDNFFHVALVMLAVVMPAAAIDPHGTIPAPRAWALGLVFVPTLMLVLYCYTGRPPLPLGFEGRNLVHTEADRGALYRFIRSETPADAVFVVDTAAPDVAMAGNTAELPALTGRVLFVERPSHYIVEPYADLERRTRIAGALVEGAPLDDADDRYLGGLGRPIYIVDYHADRPPGGDARSGPDSAPVFAQGKVSLRRYVPDAERAGGGA